MAQVVGKMAVRAGYTIPVKNIDKKPTENKQYVAIWVEDFNGGNERCILLTQKELARLSRVGICDLKDEMKRGRLYRVGYRGSYFIKVKIGDEDTVVRISKVTLKRAEERAEVNEEDIPKMGILIDLFDL